MPNLEKVAKSYEIPFFKVEQFSDLAKTIADFFAVEGPAFLEVVSLRVQEIVPSVSSVRLENGSMKSKPLHDMFPFMTEAELAEALKI